MRRRRAEAAGALLAGLKPGRSYNLRELKGVPYTVKNRGAGRAGFQRRGGRDARGAHGGAGAVKRDREA
jgi:hypothetical protein